MAIKSKSAKSRTPAVTFSGLVSWICMLFLLYAAMLMVACLAITVFDPEILKYLASLFNTIFVDETAFLRVFSSISLLLFTFLFTFLFRNKRKAFELSIAKALNHVFVELKLILIIVSLAISFASGIILLLLLVVFLCLYLVCLDIGHNQRFFKHNSIQYILEKLNQDRRPFPFEIYFSKRLSTVIIVILGVLALFIFLFALLWYSQYQLALSTHNFYMTAFFLILFAISGIVGAVSWYSLTMKKECQDLTQIIRQIEKMYAGDLDAVNHVPPISSFYDMAMQLNMIRSGIQRAVDEGTKADKTKVELITNVSHDIKTPLTSIITYVELLKLESDLSDTSRDYVNTISSKAERLSRIVQDVFEISKAATGNLSLDSQTLDITKLLHQTMVEMEEDMKNSSITWRIEIPEKPATVYADGQKLYRIFQNLIRNCIQYSLEGSRAYISLSNTNDTASVVIRNISKKELEPSAAEYLTGRFVRGDQTRSSEGSGLGLSIAKSFTEACGGKFTLRIEGDIFYTLVQFPLVTKKINPPFSSTGNPPLVRGEQSSSNQTIVD